MTPQQRYSAALQTKQITADPAQAECMTILEALYQKLHSHYAWGSKLSLQQRWRLLRKGAVPGMYLWGGVGCGKTMLMDYFFAAIPSEDKLRLHFHRFMRQVHSLLTQHQGARDPLALVAADFAKQARVLCLDEFFVDDVADAMLLAGLLHALLREKVTLVITSNQKPEELYKNGVQRQRFLPAIDLINKHTRIYHFEQHLDHRLRKLAQLQLYITPADAAAEARLTAEFSALATSDITTATQIEVEGRYINVKQLADGIVWFDFDALCGGPRSVHDYIEIAKLFHTVLVSNVPLMDVDYEEPARRFVHMIDEFYDRKVKLILSAARPATELYQGRKVVAAFTRTLSRLTEMQSQEYLALPHGG